MRQLCGHGLPAARARLQPARLSRRHPAASRIIQRTIPLSEEQAGLFRQVARRTWGFFERFVGPEDHWLPPDHFQEAPVGIIAHHTSPSNIGLLFTSTLAAYDFGYLDQLGLATRLSHNDGYARPAGTFPRALFKLV